MSAAGKAGEAKAGGKVGASAGGKKKLVVIAGVVALPNTSARAGAVEFLPFPQSLA